MQPVVQETDCSLSIHADGTWHYYDQPLERITLIRLLYTVLSKEAHGQYFIITPVETVPVCVEDAPYSVLSIEWDKQGQGIQCWLNDGTVCPINAAHPIRFAEHGAVYIHVRYDRHHNSLEARLTFRAYMQFAELLEVVNETTFLVRSYGSIYTIQVPRHQA